MTRKKIGRATGRTTTTDDSDAPLELTEALVLRGDEPAAPAPGEAAPTVPPPAPSADGAEPTNVAVSRGLAQWLGEHRVSLAFSCYQSGQLFLVGVLPNGSVSLNQQNFVRAMGVSWHNGRLYLGGLNQVWRLENMLEPGQRANQHFDVALVPRNAQTTGDVDIHEVGIDQGGHVVFVNTKYSCLATLDLRHSFRPLWKPPFISRLAPEDRCHMNGMAMMDGAVRYVTAVSRSDVVDGWRQRRHEGGVLIDTVDGRIVTDKLSMPHSPRVARDGSVVLLDSGRGQIVRVDPESGARTDLTFCPGFLRGMALVDGHAIVTVSKPRNGSFSGLALDDELARRDAEPWCGVLIVSLASGDVVEWIRLEGGITELFDVTAMPDVVCPMAIGPNTAQMSTTVTFEPLRTEAAA